MGTITLGQVSRNLEELRELKKYMEDIDKQLSRTPEQAERQGYRKQTDLDIDILNNTKRFLQYRIDGLESLEIKLNDNGIPF